MKYMKPFNLFQYLLNSNPIERGRLLGLDVGDKYVGLAVSDFHNQIASPLRYVICECKRSELSLSGFIFGYPLNRQRGSLEAVQVKLFVEDLCKTGQLEGLKYTFWDECFTLKNAELLLKDLNLHPVQSKTIVDKFAAVGIIQGYLDFANKSIKMKSAQIAVNTISLAQLR